MNKIMLVTQELAVLYLGFLHSPDIRTQIREN